MKPTIHFTAPSPQAPNTLMFLSVSTQSNLTADRLEQRWPGVASAALPAASTLAQTSFLANLCAKTICGKAVLTLHLVLNPQVATAQLRQLVARGISTLRQTSAETLAVVVAPELVQRLDVITTAIGCTNYRFDQLKTRPSQIPTGAIKLVIDLPNKARRQASALVKKGNTVAAAITTCRHLVNAPTNHLGVDQFIVQTRALLKDSPVRLQVWRKSAIEKRGLGLLAGVAKGSSFEPALLQLTYGKTGDRQHVALVGKGIVFDTGGLCLKPAGAMGNMKTDMAGAATVVAVMSKLAALNCSTPVKGYIALAENAIGPDAMRPGDVLSSHLGRTVEVTNTDAEGRLVLADAISLAATHKPAELVTLATLTGAAKVALGLHRAALFSTASATAQQLCDIGNKVGEPLWTLPLANELIPQLQSQVADFRNSADRFGGAITAALFLKQFAGTNPFTHIDMAGPARNSEATPFCPEGGTGFGVGTLLEYLSVKRD